MLGSGRRRRVGALSAAAAVFGAVALAAGIASGATRPTIVGPPIVGVTLSISVPQGFDGLYQWQSCNPAVANCSDSLEHNDSNWTDLPPIATDRHNNTNYTIVAADLGHFIRVLAKDNSLGNGTWVPSPPIGPVIAGDAPQHGISVLVKPAGGSVKVKKPGERDFGDLKKLEKIPVNSVVDTRGGRVEVTAATGNFAQTTADTSLLFYDGLISLQQAGTLNAPATAKLVEDLRCPNNVGGEAKAGKSSGPVATTSRKRRRRRVWGSGSGNYSTSGSGGTGSVRGTTWLTKDTCRGTFFKVTEGIGITVHDFDLNQDFDLGPGQTYFARNR
jgi:hypothetical protein